MLREQLKIAEKELEGRHYGTGAEAQRPGTGLAQRVAEQELEANDFHAETEKAGKGEENL
jgi:hypothetical protein